MFERAYLDPYVIAEIGVNHEGSLERAKEQIRAAARAGAHAAKFQTYTAGLLASATSSPAYWDTTKEATPSQHELFSKYDSFGPDEYAALAETCGEAGVDFISTPFDLGAVDMLEPLVPAFKVASADLTNVPLLRKVARTGKPVILSTGASTVDEVEWALRILEGAGAQDITLLHCVLRYPAPPEVANLGVIKTLQAQFGDRAKVGYSDHVAPDEIGLSKSIEVASLMGAVVIEKHFTDDRTSPGNDHYHALDEAGLREFTDALATYRSLAGTGVPDLDDQREAISNARRRIFVARPVPAGSVLDEADLIALRANVGLDIAQWDDVIGRKAHRDLATGAALTSDDLGVG